LTPFAHFRISSSQIETTFAKRETTTLTTNQPALLLLLLCRHAIVETGKPLLNARKPTPKEGSRKRTAAAQDQRVRARAQGKRLEQANTTQHKEQPSTDNPVRSHRFRGPSQPTSQTPTDATNEGISLSFRASLFLSIETTWIFSRVLNKEKRGTITKDTQRLEVQGAKYLLASIPDPVL
jgi:hypothetical protein